MSGRSDEDQLDDFHQEVLEMFMPVMTIMGIVCLLGIVGNAFTIGFYGCVARQTPTVFLITVLAIVDLIVTALIIPNIAEMAVNVKYTNAAACKIMHFFGHWTIETSALLLGFIAVDRYRHVCCPFKSQVTFVIAKKAVIIITVVSLLLSIRDFFNFDIIKIPIKSKENNNTDAIGHYCTTRDDSDFKVSVTVFHSIDFLTVVAILVTFFITYGKIIWTIKKKGFSYTVDDKKSAYRDKSQSEEATKDTSDDQKNDILEMEDKPDKPDQSVDNSSSDQDVKQKKAKDNQAADHAVTKTKSTERSITLMMLAISVVFCLCFVPYFIIKIGIRSYKSASQLELGAGVQLALRFTYVNSFANPIVFCIFNPQLRRFILNTAIRRKGCSRNK